MNKRTDISSGKDSQREGYDVLSLYHHLTYPIDSKLLELLEVLEQPRNVNIDYRFKKLSEILDEKFCLELAQRLELRKFFNTHKESTDKAAGEINLMGEINLAEIIFHKPALILRLWCSLICSGSVDYVAKYTNLTLEETLVLIREIDFSYNIDSLISRVLGYYQASKKYRLQAEINKNEQLLGLELTTVSPDSQEERRVRLRKKLGDLAKIKDYLLSP